MAQYLHSDSSFVVDVDNVFIQTHQDKCLCCLSQNIPLVSLTTCKHTSFFEFFFKYKVDYQSSLICCQCHHMLKKIDAFRSQVDDSFRVLNDQTHTSIKIHQNLQFSKTNFTNASSDQEFDDLKLEPIVTTTISPVDHYTDIITDVKIEHESCSDFETDVPLSEIKKEISIKKVGKKKKKKVKSKKAGSDSKEDEKKRSNIRQEKYEGKIRIVTLTREEMMIEREELAKKESYLKLPYKCESCITGFDHELTLEDHMKKRHGEKKGGFLCDICKSVLSTLTSYKEHTKRHTRRYECVECGKRNNNVYSVAKHYNDKHGCIETEFSCQDCGFTTHSHRSYRYHRDKHRQKQHCALCDSSFVNSAGLRVHMFTVHKQSSRVYSCDECGKVYAAKSGLAAHARTHGPTRGAWCVECRTHFRTAHNLQHHLRTHSRHLKPQDKKFACNECESKFLTKVALQEHFDFVHLKTNKYECEKCSRVFKNNSALKKHDNFVHKKLRPPRNKICDHCGRGFTTLSILQAHIRTHTGERPLRCSRCAACFAHSAALYTHAKLLHGRTDRSDNTT